MNNGIRVVTLDNIPPKKIISAVFDAPCSSACNSVKSKTPGLVIEIDFSKTENTITHIKNAVSKYFPDTDMLCALLILEEVVTNVEKYAYNDGDKFQLLQIYMYHTAEETIFIFEDFGKEFNPIKFSLPEPDSEQIGGHGIRMIRRMSSAMEYKRTEDGRNILAIEIA